MAEANGDLLYDGETSPDPPLRRGGMRLAECLQSATWSVDQMRPTETVGTSGRWFAKFAPSCSISASRCTVAARHETPTLKTSLNAPARTKNPRHAWPSRLQTRDGRRARPRPQCHEKAPRRIPQAARRADRGRQNPG